MSRHGDITLEWADGEYTFRLGIGEIRKLQERTDCGPYELFDRISTRKFKVDELRETVRLGLVGGGQCKAANGVPDDRRINRLIKDYVDERPIIPTMLLCAKILNAALAGSMDEPVPKSTAKESRPQSSKEESSPSPPSTDGGPSSVTDQPISTP